MRKKFEYTAISVEEQMVKDTMENEYNKLGVQGWELVSVITHVLINDNDTPWITAFFKREIID